LFYKTQNAQNYSSKHYWQSSAQLAVQSNKLINQNLYN